MGRPSNAPIHDEQAYNDAVARRIRENARKGRGARWLVEDPTREALVERLGHFSGSTGFLGKMAENYDHWHFLTEGQEAAVRKALEAADARRAALRAADAGSRHVGKIGERRVITGTVKFTSEYESSFGLVEITGIVDAGGNIYVHKGRRPKGCPLNGEPIVLKATVKEHGERDGVAQTIITRPVLLMA